jgi:radical SAM superfamily enzyme YgiQ (UPF0313 family)
MSSRLRLLLIVASTESVYGRYKKLYKKGFLNPPIHLCYIASAAEKAGHDVRIIDGDAEQADIRKIVAMAGDFRPHLTGITSTSVDFEIAKHIVSALKAAYPETPIVIGGTHTNIFGKQVLEMCPDIDFGCLGDGEDLIVELLEALQAGGEDRVASIDGLVYRRDGAIMENAHREIVKDIDAYPFPARHLLRNELYYRAVPHGGYKTTTAFMSSRGCPFKCAYCAVKNITGGKVVRLRSAENVLDELDYIVNKMNISHISFNDDCLTLNKQRIYDICEGIHKRSLKFTWEGLSRADLVDGQLLKAMRKAGFVRISYGIESGNPKILEILNKGETLEQIEEAFRVTEEAGIVARGSIIIGSPYETKETVKETFRFIRRLKGLDQAVVNIMQPYPGTKVREMFLKGEGGAKFACHPDELGRLQRFGGASVSVNDLSPEDLVFLQRFGFLMFFIRPKALWNNFRISGLKVFLHDGMSFMRSVVGI